MRSLSFVKKRLAIIFLAGCLLFAKEAAANSVQYYISSGCTIAQNFTIDAYITSAPSNAWYNWQYKDAGGVWKCFVNGSNTINGVSFTVSGASAQNIANNSPLLTIQSATLALDNVQLRVLMREGGNPCNAPSGTVWNGDDQSPDEAKTYRIHIYSNASDCGSSTPGCIGNFLTNGSGYYGGFENKVYNSSSSTFTDNNFISGTASTQYSLGGTNGTNPQTSGSGTYQVWNNPYAMNSSNGKFAPHTGNYQMIVHGSANTTRKVWYKTVNVIPGATYNFCVWVARTQGSNTFNLQLTVNNNNVATSAVSTTVGSWAQVCGSYLVPAGVTSFEISITDVATSASRYFSIDDICFTQTASPVGVSGTVFNDANALIGTPANTVDGTGTNAGGLTAVLVNALSGVVVASTAVAANGTYSFIGLAARNYNVLITTNTATVGAPPPAVALPFNWINTGENFGAGSGNDGTVNGILPLGAVSSIVTNANFGVQQLPTAYDATLSTQSNPGGNVQIPVPASNFKGTDPEDGTVTNKLHFTSFPENATSIVINGISYMNTPTPSAGFISWPLIGVTVPVNPVVTIDPVDGTTTVVISYKAIDNGGQESSNTGKVYVPFIVTATPDLTPRISLNPGNIIGRSTMEITIQLNEIAKVSTDGTVITMYVDKLANLSNFAFNSTATINAAGQTIQNSLFTVDGISNPDFYVITTNVLLNNAARRVMFSVTVDPLSTNATTPINVFLQNGSGGENNFLNNHDFANITYSFGL